MSTAPVAQSGTFDIGGEETVNRLGFGAMQLTGSGVWGDPDDPEECVRVLRRASELGVNLIDTADSYGPFVSEMLIKRALHPYPDDLVIATKAGLTRSGPGDWRPVGRPEYLRQQCMLSLRHLGVERIDLYQLHRIDPKVPADEQFGALKEFQREGLVRHVGLSEVSTAEIDAARKVLPIVSTQNRYNLGDREWESVVDYCDREGLAFIPWFPLSAGDLDEGGPLARVAKRHGATVYQVALAWLLARSETMLVIPGTSSVAHLEENCAAATLQLPLDLVAILDEAA
jgi:aryl-alcohol dehydrogenase-like predicted oxidoreductase